MIQSIWKPIRKRLLSIPQSEILFQARGFRPTSEEARVHLEGIGRSFLEGYHEALREPGVEVLGSRLGAMDGEKRGFAFEGAAMAVWLLDSLSCFHRNRWNDFLKYAANTHPYVLHVGVGWALARLPWTRKAPERVLSRFEPLLRWLVIDGYGFHEGYFHAAKWIRSPCNRPNLSRYACQVFDQGLGRSIWFVEGADVVQIAATIATFDPDRHADLWSGVGLACAYAGQATVPEIEYLMSSAKTRLEHLRQGITFGAEARVRGQIANEFTDRTCMATCGMNSLSVAHLARTAQADVEQFSDSHELPRYEQWRARIRQIISKEALACNWTTK